MSTEPEKLPDVEPVEPAAQEPPKAPAVEPETVEREARTETFDAVRPDGVAVTVTRNLDTGEQSVEIHE